MAAPEQCLQPSAHFLIDWVELRQAQGGDEGADQLLAGQVYALAKRAAQYGKAYAGFARAKALHKSPLLRLVHARALLPLGQQRVACPQGLAGLAQVVKAAEKGQVVTGGLVPLVGNQSGDRSDRACPVSPACRDLRYEVHL